ncbi:MAG: TonB-dependent receptor [Bacteroidales bacterium]|nr:TonB-dependent receptor [Bacteroidales bacterium]
MNLVLLGAVLSGLLVPGAGTENDMPETKEDRIDSVVVAVSRAGRNSPVTYTSIGSEELRRANPMESLPMVLSLEPSVITKNEGGTGLGYSSMTIRGVKGSQTNVTLDGITLNDAESQEVFWVNIPALSSILGSVQLQRGLGTSASGSGAFGASVNMSTALVSPSPSVRLDLTAGSYGTACAAVSAGSGLLKHGFYVNGAYSFNNTDGYIRNAKVRAQSALINAGWLGNNDALRITWLMGDQHSGITWNGISPEMYLTDRRYNSAGEYTDALGRTCYYDNETDNYTQNHINANYSHNLELSSANSLVLSAPYHYTRGDGYYEQYKVKATDSITRKEMGNNLSSALVSLKYNSGKLTLAGGLGGSFYDGNHFGTLLWDSGLGEGYDYSSFDWYRNRADKDEASAFIRTDWAVTDWLSAFADLQYRGVWYRMEGPEDEEVPLDFKDDWQFFNPRLGLSAGRGGHKAHAFAALAGREPGRADLKEVIITRNSGGDHENLRPEKMVDVELGYEYSSPKVSASANFYFMEYFDMLLETGKISDVGYAIKENVKRSYRRGLELCAAYKPLRWLNIDANLTLSLNRILDYTAYFDLYDDAEDWGFVGQRAEHFENTAIRLSPSVIGMARASVMPCAGLSSDLVNNLKVTVDCKYVGRQYWDNTASKEREIPAYAVGNLSISNDFKTRRAGTVGFSFYLSNFTSNLYYADAWVYRAVFASGEPDYIEAGLFPQAPINWSLRLSYTF